MEPGPEGTPPNEMQLLDRVSVCACVRGCPRPRSFYLFTVTVIALVDRETKAVKREVVF